MPYATYETTTIDYDGEPVVIKFRRLTRAELMGLQKFFISTTTEDGKTVVNVAAGMLELFMDHTDELIPACVQEFGPITVDGEPWRFTRLSDVMPVRGADLLATIINDPVFSDQRITLSNAIMGASTVQTAGKKPDASASTSSES